MPPRQRLISSSGVRVVPVEMTVNVGEGERGWDDPGSPWVANLGLVRGWEVDGWGGFP